MRRTDKKVNLYNVICLSRYLHSSFVKISTPKDTKNVPESFETRSIKNQFKEVIYEETID